MAEKSRDERPSAEYSAKTVADALKRAAEDLKVPVEELEHEVIQERSRSILGLVRTGEVVIRVWRRAQTPEAAPAQEEETVPETKLMAAELLEEEEETEFAAPPAKAKGNPPELEKVAREVVATLLDKMDIIAAVEVVDRGGQADPVTNEVSPLVLNIVGDDLGVLIGRRGETLRDLQFIVRLIISRKLHCWPNVVIDVEGYKARRVRALQTLAKRIADQVRQSRQIVALEPMPAHERRIVHLALRDDPDVYTESTGEGEERKVQVIPKALRKTVR